jgi:hypothetical protein
MNVQLLFGLGGPGCGAFIAMHDLLQQRPGADGDRVRSEISQVRLCLMRLNGVLWGLIPP